MRNLGVSGPVLIGSYRACQAIKTCFSPQEGSELRINSLSCTDSYLAAHDTLRYPFAINEGNAMPDSIDIQLKKGVLGLCVLALLARSDSYAYEIASRLSDAIGMGEGTIYPLMRRMQSDGLVETYMVESSSGPSRKYYRLTAAGRAALEGQTAEWRAFAQAVDALVAGTAPHDETIAAGAPVEPAALTDQSADAQRGAEQ